MNNSSFQIDDCKASELGVARLELDSSAWDAHRPGADLSALIGAARSLVDRGEDFLANGFGKPWDVRGFGMLPRGEVAEHTLAALADWAAAHGLELVTFHGVERCFGRSTFEAVRHSREDHQLAIVFYTLDVPAPPPRTSL